MENKWIKWGGIVALVIGTITLLYNKVYIPKTTYRVVSPQKGDLALTVFGIGTVSAKKIHPIASSTGGKILEIFKDQGELVKKGEIIALLDQVDLPDQLTQAQALLEKARHETVAAQKELKALHAQLELTKLTFDRYDKLHQKGYAAQAEYDKAYSDLKVVQAQIEASKARIASSLSEQKSVQKSIDAIRQKITRFRIVSPIDGYIIRKDVEAGQTIALQQPIVTIVDPREVWIKAYIDERISGKIAKGQKAGILLRSKAGERLPGYVARIEAESDPVTEERVVDVAFDKAPFPFYINEQAEVTIQTGLLHDVLLVPINLIRRGGVWVYQNGEAHFKKLKILGRNDKLAAVRGVTEHEKILVPDRRKKPLYEGADVRI